MILIDTYHKNYNMKGPGDKIKAFMQKLIKPNGNVVGGRDTNKALKNLKKKGLDDPSVANELLYNKKTPTNEELNQQMTQRNK